MFCPNCGEYVDDTAMMCAKCGVPLKKEMPQKIDNHLVGAILVTLCCCLPFGIVSIVKACQVNTKLAQGDFAGAQESANSAQKWITLSIVLGLISLVLNIIIQFAATIRT